MLELEDPEEPIGRNEPVEPSLGIDHGDAAASAPRRCARRRFEVGFGQDLRRLLRKLADACVGRRGEQPLDRDDSGEAPVVEHGDLSDAGERAVGKRRTHLGHAGVGNCCRDIGDRDSTRRALEALWGTGVGHDVTFAAPADTRPATAVEEAMASEHAIEVDRLVVVRGGARALADVTLTVRRGAVTGLLGPSGSGKTTLMRSIVGVQRIESGTVRVLGEEGGAPALRRRVSYTTQAPSVYLDLSVRENLRYFARILDAPAERIDEVLRTVDLVPLAGHVVGRLSGGEQARVALGTALLGNPELLVLDEPTVGLDPVLRRELWSTFAVLARNGATLLVSSHVMSEAERCDSLVLLRGGRLLAAGTVAEIRARAGTEDMEDAFLRLVGDESS